jgi:hypothetical protein
MPALSELFNASLVLVAKASGIWFVVWAIRKKGEFDYELDWTACIVRWLVVFVAFALTAEFTKSGPTIARILVLVIGLAFLCWPNFAYHLVRFSRTVLEPREHQR